MISMPFNSIADTDFHTDVFNTLECNWNFNFQTNQENSGGGSMALWPSIHQKLSYNDTDGTFRFGELRSSMTINVNLM